MKNFKFSLDPLLRLKDVEKKKIELELARCQIEIERHQEQLDSENNSIFEMLREAEYSVNKNHRVTSLLAIPSIMEQKKRNIKIIEKKIHDFKNTQREILDRLNKKNSELKKVEEHKEEKFQEFRKAVEKKQEEDRSELYNAMLHHKARES